MQALTFLRVITATDSQLQAVIQLENAILPSIPNTTYQESTIKRAISEHSDDDSEDWDNVDSTSVKVQIKVMNIH